jgi:hypothetical protein
LEAPVQVLALSGRDRLAGTWEEFLVASIASPLEVPKPTIFHVAYLNLTRISGVLGLASIADGFKVWRGFLAEIVKHYQEWIRQPIYKALIVFWPADWPVPPKFGIDLFIVWAAFFAAASYHVYYEDGRNILSHIYAAEKLTPRATRAGAIVRTIAKVITIFVIGPLFYPLKALSHSARKNQLMITRWLVMNPRAILKYVFFQFLALVILLLINYTTFNQGQS